MKNQFLALAAITFGLMAIAPSALAGEGGIAAAAAFHIDPTTGKVTDIAVAAGIGKTSAVAGAELDYSSVLTSTSTFGFNNSSNNYNSSSNSSYSGSGGCYYYFYCYSGPSTSTSASNSTYNSTSLSYSTSTYQPVTSVKAFAVGSAGSLSYSPGYGYYYYYYGSGPSIYIGGEDPSSVGTAQANTFNVNATTSGVSIGP